jgi:protein-S-isoprenylcysteine O-methyltransferase Ste14
MLGRIISVSIVLAVVVLLAILQTTTPSTAGPIGILFVFIFIYMLVLGALTFLLFWGSRLLGKVLHLVAQKTPRRSLSLTRSYYFSSILALAPVIFMGMQSVGEVGFYDVALVLLFVGVGCFYVAKRTA